jgi:predicted phosphate transport protein (TIGR00153 family)
MVRLIPREPKFFRMFAEVSHNLTEGARLLHEILKKPADMGGRLDKLQEIEHRGDELTHSIITTLNQTFITPFDREDIHRLTSSLDDVLDFVNSAGVRLRLYRIDTPPPVAAELAGLIVQQSEELAKAVSLLARNQRVLEHCVEVHRLENEADRVSRNAIAELFDSEKDPIRLIKVKELYEVLETATDKAEDAANVLEAVTLKSA